MLLETHLFKKKGRNNKACSGSRNFYENLGNHSGFSCVSNTFAKSCTKNIQANKLMFSFAMNALPCPANIDCERVAPWEIRGLLRIHRRIRPAVADGICNLSTTARNTQPHHTRSRPYWRAPRQLCKGFLLEIEKHVSPHHCRPKFSKSPIHTCFI